MDEESDEEMEEESDEDSDEETKEESDEDSDEEMEEESDEDSDEETEEESDEDSDEEMEEESDEDSDEETKEESGEDNDEDTEVESDEDSDEEITEEIVEKADENIGSELNKWVFPVNKWGMCEKEWKLNIKNQLGQIDFSKQEWTTSCSVVKCVLKKLLDESRDIAAEIYKGLNIMKYIYQGSAREGLKVIEPDEFDTIILFKLNGIPLEMKRLKEKTQIIPEVGKLTVVNSITEEQLKNDYSTLFDNNVFFKDNDEYCIDARRLFFVFEHIFRKAIQKIKCKIKLDKNSVIDEITVLRNEPSINLKIKYSFNNDDKQVDVDVVPAVVIEYGEMKLPRHYKKDSAKCPVYAVLKWVRKENPVWRICYSAFEKHHIDEARNYVKGLLVLNSLRLLKAFFKRESNNSSTFKPIAKVVGTYHLKNIMFYVLAWLFKKHREIEIRGVQQVLPYFVVFLYESIRHRKLPHFFHSSSLSSLQISDSIRYNLFYRNHENEMLDAKTKFRKHFKKIIDYEKYDKDEMISTFRKEYVMEIKYGDFIQREMLHQAIQKRKYSHRKNKMLMKKSFLYAKKQKPKRLQKQHKRYTEHKEL